MAETIEPFSKDDGLFLDFIEKYLVVDGAKCNRHCDRPAKFVPIIRESSSLVGAYVCPDNYVSRVVYFSDRPDKNWFSEFLSSQVGTSWLRSRDIRVATRHGWELGGNAESEIARVSASKNLKEYYWTFYARTEEDKQTGTFLCEECGRLFTNPLSNKNKLCTNCRSKGKSQVAA